MFLKNSRYAKSQRFEPDPDGRVDFRGIRPRLIAPGEAVLEHSITDHDRPDHLAGHYYALDRAWYRIMDTNPEFMIAGPLYQPNDETAGPAAKKLKKINGGDSIISDAETGDVMLSDAVLGTPLLIPKRQD